MHTELDQPGRFPWSQRFEVGNHRIGQRVADPGMRNVIRRPFRIKFPALRVTVNIVPWDLHRFEIRNTAGPNTGTENSIS